LSLKPDDVRLRLAAGQTAAQAGDPGADDHHASQVSKRASKPLSNRSKGHSPDAMKNTKIQIGQ
jgi:hypothetical protein